MVKALVSLVVLIAAASNVMAHCEIPCGIFTDRLRFEELREHFETIEKSMVSIDELSEADQVDHNNLVRWIMNKEDHVDKVHKIVYQYFLNQRVAPVAGSEEEGWDNYVKQLTLLHNILVESMRCRHSTETDHIENLRNLLDEYEKVYFGDDIDHECHSHDEDSEHEHHGGHGHSH